MPFLFDKPVSLTQVASKEIRDNFNAIGTLNITDNENLPSNPRDGMPRLLIADLANIKLQVWLDNEWKTLINYINVGPVPRRLEFSFTTLDTSWVCDHNLGVRPSGVQAMDDADRVIVPQSIQHASVNRVIVQHTIPVTGKVILVG